MQDNSYGLALARGLDEREATYFTYLKLVLSRLKDMLPQNLRDNLIEVGTSFEEILNVSCFSKILFLIFIFKAVATAPQEKLREAFGLFNTAVIAFRQDPVVRNVLFHYYSISAWLMPNRVVLPRNDVITL